VSVLLTYSRGALLGLGVVLCVIALKSNQKILSACFLLASAWVVLSFAPGKWMDRMGNFLRGNLDNSAELRLNAWQFAYELAKHHPFTGGGLKTFTPGLYQVYTPQLDFAGPHSIYFQMLGESGFVGLGLFSLLLATTLFSLIQVRRSSRLVPSAQWIIPYTHMLEVGLLAFMISGAFLEFAHFDLFYQLVASTVLLHILFRKELILVGQPKRSHELAETSPELVRA